MLLKLFQGQGKETNSGCSKRTPGRRLFSCVWWWINNFTVVATAVGDVQTGSRQECNVWLQGYKRLSISGLVTPVADLIVRAMAPSRRYGMDTWDMTQHPAP